MAKGTRRPSVSRGLGGVGNQLSHQYIISDLLYGIRRKLQRAGIDRYAVVSEISISKLAYETKPGGSFSRDHNIDIAVVDKRGGSVRFMVEIERQHGDLKRTKSKLKECLQYMTSLQEVMMITFDAEGYVLFNQCFMEGNNLAIVPSSSKSRFLDMVLVRSLVSLK